MKYERPIDRALRWAAEDFEIRKPADFARLIDESPQTVNNWKARGMPADKHEKVAARLGRHIDELVKGVAPTAQTQGGHSRHVTAPPYTAEALHDNTRLRVGELVKTLIDGALAPMPQSKGSDLGYLELRHPADGLLAIQVRGDGLAPTIDDGRVMLVKPDVECAPGEWILITMRDGSRLCKKLLINKGHALEVSDLATQKQSTIDVSQIKAVAWVITAYSAKALRFGEVPDQLNTEG